MNIARWWWRRGFVHRDDPSAGFRWDRNRETEDAADDGPPGCRNEAAAAPEREPMMIRAAILVLAEAPARPVIILWNRSGEGCSK